MNITYKNGARTTCFLHTLSLSTSEERTELQAKKTSFSIHPFNMQPIVNFSNSQFPTDSGEFCRDFLGHNTKNNVMS